MSFNPRPYLTQDKRIRSSLAYAFVAVLLLLTGIYYDFDPLIGLALAGMFIALLFALIFWSQRRQLRRILDPMVQGDRFVHWTYAPEEWQLHLRGEKKRVPHQLRTYCLMGFALGLALGILIFVAEFWLEKRGLSASLKYGALGILPLLVTCLIVGICEELIRSRRLRELGYLGGEVYIGRDGLYYSGALYPRTFYRTLQWKEGNDQPGLLFRFEVPIKGGVTRTEEILIPVPARGLNQAQEVARRVQETW